MEKYNHKTYTDYLASQKRDLIKIKKAWSWTGEDNIRVIAETIRGLNPKRGLCHGTRFGFEQQWFKKYLPGCKVIGTELNLVNAPDTYIWDFNEPHQDWIGEFDFVYSNSYDHCFDPEVTFRVWCNQVKRGGVLIFEHGAQHERATKKDPVGMTVEELVKHVEASGCADIKIIDLPFVQKKYQKAVLAYL